MKLAMHLLFVIHTSLNRPITVFGHKIHNFRFFVCLSLSLSNAADRTKYASDRTHHLSDLATHTHMCCWTIRCDCAAVQWAPHDHQYWREKNSRIAVQLCGFVWPMTWSICVGRPESQNRELKHIHETIIGFRSRCLKKISCIITNHYPPNHPVIIMNEYVRRQIK